MVTNYLPRSWGCAILPQMLYYYVVPCYLTVVFLAAYWLVHGILLLFDLINPFWDFWDGLHRRQPSLFVVIEYGILGSMLYYIVTNVLSGTP